MVFSLTRDFNVMSNCNFFFVVFFPYSKFIFTYHVQHIINKFGSDVEAVEDPDGHAIKFYDPLPSREYVRLIKVELLKMREALAQALKDRRYAENETMKWHLLVTSFTRKPLVMNLLSPILHLHQLFVFHLILTHLVIIF